MNNINAIKSNSYDMLSFILWIKKNTIKQYFSNNKIDILNRENIKSYIEHIQFQLPWVYCIENVFDWMKYIWKSENIKTRINHHFSLLKSKTHWTKKLQIAYDKYGRNAFIFYIVEYCNDSKELIRREREIIDSYNPSLLYNSDDISNIFIFVNKNRKFIEYCMEDFENIKWLIWYKE